MDNIVVQILSVVLLIALIYCLLYYVKYKREVNIYETRLKKDREMFKTINMDQLILKGYGFLIEDKFDKFDEIEIGAAIKNKNIKIEGLFEKELNIKHHYFTLKRYTFDSPSAKYPVYMLCNQLGNKKFFAWQFEEIADYIKLS